METKWNGFQTVITQRSNHNLSLLPHLISFRNYKNRTNYNFLFPFDWKQTVHHIFTELYFTFLSCIVELLAIIHLLFGQKVKTW